MRINTNVASLQAQESAISINNKLSSSLEKLSTSLRINKASDDGAGLAIADKLRTQAHAINQSISNGNSAISLTQIADKAMGEQSRILNTVKIKLIQSATDSTSAEGKKSVEKDINILLNQLNGIASQTSYAGTSLLQAGSSDTNARSSLIFQVGENAADTISTNSGIQSNTSGLGLSNLKTEVANSSVITANLARTYTSAIDSAIDKLNSWRAEYGSTQIQLESAVRNQMTQKTNILNAESVIRDVDYAQESTNFNKQNIIAQAGTYAITQANAIQQNVSRLLQ
ncbi:flagellin [Arcobacter sp. CECT 8986]|uniref:flagellin N-terminal helical domain-containing protein n=1 Tax=Arcobacter sp. CECT 8986 TaxID=2044507 RepID=UPI001009D58C|nr:flagellin [Arcobacter sp. CECT 8986]RXJ98228.1 flagellin [Arcobacter sp. CECT 8986]